MHTYLGVSEIGGVDCWLRLSAKISASRINLNIVGFGIESRFVTVPGLCKQEPGESLVEILKAFVHLVMWNEKAEKL